MCSGGMCCTGEAIMWQHAGLLKPHASLHLLAADVVNLFLMLLNIGEAQWVFVRESASLAVWHHCLCWR